MQVHQVAQPVKKVIEAHMNLKEALAILAETDAEFLPVIYNGEITAIINLQMVTKHVLLNQEWEHTKVQELEAKNYLIVGPSTPIEKIMNKGQKYIVVAEKGTVSGVLCLNDAFVKIYGNMVQARDELEVIVDSMHDGIGVANEEGRIIRLNKSYERMTGLTKEEAGLGKLLVNVEKEGIISQSIALQVLKKRKPVTISQRIKTGMEFLATGIPVFNDEGKITRVIVNFRDLSELNRLREEIDKSKDLSARYHMELETLRKKQLLTSINVKSPAMTRVFELANLIATVDTTVLITGESGVGKEVVARYIHSSSHRNNSPFIQINCGAIPDNLLESELFGYEGGAFTGANQDGKPGLFEVANNGTIFLDEIGEMPLNLQVKLLMVLQNREICRVGSTKPIKLDVRIIAATNQNIEALINQGRFREDLFYRLNVVPIEIPPLRERVEDILPLSLEFLTKFNEKYSHNKRFDLRALQILETYSWPGNIRQLENLIERMVITTQEDVIKPQDAANYLKFPSGRPESGGGGIIIQDIIPLKRALSMVEKELVKRALKLHGTTRNAAKVLEVGHSSIIRKVEKYKLHRELVDYHSRKAESKIE